MCWLLILQSLNVEVAYKMRIPTICMAYLALRVESNIAATQRVPRKALTCDARIGPPPKQATCAFDIIGRKLKLVSCRVASAVRGWSGENNTVWMCIFTSSRIRAAAT